MFLSPMSQKVILCPLLINARSVFSLINFTGPAAVASIAIPRSAVATAAVIRPAPSASANAVPQTTR